MKIFKKIKKNRIFKSFFILFLPILTIISPCFWDMMQEIFEPVQQNIFYIWTTPSSVWSTVLQQQTEAGFLTINTEETLIVRLVKFILKITIILSVTMVIYYSVKFLLQVFGGNDLKSIGAKKDLINLIIWLLIALFSITAIELIISIPKSSLKTSGDLSQNIQHELLWKNSQNIITF